MRVDLVPDEEAANTFFDALKAIVSDQKVKEYLKELSENKQIRKANKRAERFLKPYIVAKSMHDPLRK